MRYDRNRSTLDDHAMHSLIAFVAPPVAEGADAEGETGPSSGTLFV